MFKPARMSRLVMGGHKDHLEPLIETLHQEKVLHLEDFLDPTGTTTIGTPLERGDEASSLLVRVRGMLKSLDIEEAPVKTLATEHPERILREAEGAVLPVVEAASETRAELARIDGEAAALAPYEDLDVELSSLTGLRSVKGYLGLARDDPSERIRTSGIPVEVQAVPSGGRTALTVFVPSKQGEVVDRILADAGFAPASLPPATGTPRERLRELAEARAAQARRLTDLERETGRLREEWSGRLGALERFLADEVDRTQAPLQFGVTETTFHAEGWVPRSRVNRVINAVAARFGDSVYIQDLGDGPRGQDGGAPGSGGHGQVGGDGAAHEEHHDTDPAHEAPVKLENRGLALPYEFLLGLLGRPRYKEIDPTKLMLIFFPLFFGLMVGDVLVGLAIMGFGLYLKTHRIFGIGGPSVGRALVMGGFMAALIGGVVFGEALGIHFVLDQHAIDEGEPSWECILGLSVPAEGFLHVKRHEPMRCAPLEHPVGPGSEAASAGHASEAASPGGFAVHAEEADEETSLLDIKPHSDEHLSVNGWFNLGYYSKVHDIQALLIWSVAIGIAHLVLGLMIGVRNVQVAHGTALAIQEKASWLLILAAAATAIAGMTQGSNVLMAVGGGAFVVGLGLLWVGTAKVLGVGFVSVLEVLGLVGNLLSYTRIAAIGASKAGMAIAFMAIGFDILGGGSFHSAAGWVVYILGMVVITLLAVLSGGLQSLRLQFVEFFQKFYTGGGRPYVPFGRRAP